MDTTKIIALIDAVRTEVRRCSTTTFSPKLATLSIDFFELPEIERILEKPKTLDEALMAMELRDVAVVLAVNEFRQAVLDEWDMFIKFSLYQLVRLTMVMSRHPEAQAEMKIWVARCSMFLWQEPFEELINENFGFLKLAPRLSADCL